MRLPHLSDLFLFQVVPLNHYFALEGAAVPVVEYPLLGQEVGLLLSLGMLHVLLVLGQTLLLLLLGCAMVLVHLLRREQRNNVRSWTVELVLGCSKLLVKLNCDWYIMGRGNVSFIHANISSDYSWLVWDCGGGTSLTY